ncbi:PadR family transcriptional regulator [Limosilactobacillus caecicola]|uniref:PadR family transcriptional regulator n=1 Tax=Limosilactobacillus caecicola TaxID=2941332 RepID=UPI00203CE7CF|nr:PadR family transcriptional regulator [Limosilactobacillus caecicola]
MPKRRILPFIILGITNTHQRITGREITNTFSTEIGDFWQASHSQIYPELRRMTQDGWLTVSTSPTNSKEKYYDITDEGRQVLNEWLGQLVDELPIHQDLFSLKLFFIQQADDPRIGDLINQQMKLLKQNLHHLKQREQQVFPNEEAVQHHYGHYLILKRAISRTQGQLEWLNETKKKLKIR